MSIDISQLSNINSLVERRKIWIERLKIVKGYEAKAGANGGMNLTIQGTYQSDEFVIKLKPHVIDIITKELNSIDQLLNRAGISTPTDY